MAWAAPAASIASGVYGIASGNKAKKEGISQAADAARRARTNVDFTSAPAGAAAAKVSTLGQPPADASARTGINYSTLTPNSRLEDVLKPEPTSSLGGLTTKELMPPNSSQASTPAALPAAQPATGQQANVPATQAKPGINWDRLMGNVGTGAQIGSQVGGMIQAGQQAGMNTNQNAIAQRQGMSSQALQQKMALMPEQERRRLMQFFGIGA